MKQQEKLLLVGGDLATPDVIKYCKEIGVYTIMTNHIPLAENPFKQMADEAWDIPAEELDTLEAQCQDVGVTALFAGINEHNLDLTQELAKRLNLPFYASDEGWACARDKGRFKEHCISVGLDVPSRYNIKKPFTAEMLAGINYPVIVKPVDSSGQRGLSLCHSEKDLYTAFDKALQFSESGNIIVEEYIDGIEFGIPICFIEGKPIIHTFGASYSVSVNGKPTLCFGTFSRYLWNSFEKQNRDKISTLFERMGCRHGSVNLQGMYKSGRFYLLEMGYRLDGLGSWRCYKMQTGYSPLELHVDVQLGRDEKHWLTKVGSKYPPYINSSYQIYSNPGKIAKIIGLDTLRKMDGVTITFERFHEGDEVVTSGTMYQAAFFLFLAAKDEISTANLLAQINDTIHFYDKDGNNMLVYFDDFSIFRPDQE